MTLRDWAELWVSALRENQVFTLGYRRRRESLVLWHREILGIRSVSWRCNKIEFCSIRMMAMQYILYGGQLYRRSYNAWHTPSLLEERKNRKSQGRSSSKELWSSHERENISQKDPKDGVLLEYDGDWLCRLCEELPWLPNTFKLESCTSQ